MFSYQVVGAQAAEMSVEHGAGSMDERPTASGLTPASKASRPAPATAPGGLHWYTNHEKLGTQYNTDNSGLFNILAQSQSHATLVLCSV